VNRVQKLRKRAGLVVTDAIEIFFEASSPAVLSAIASNRDLVVGTLRTAPLPAQFKPPHAVELGVDPDAEIGDAKVTVYVTRPAVAVSEEALGALAQGEREMAEGLAGFLASLDYARLAGNGGRVAVRLNERHVELAHGTHFFMTSVEKVKALGTPDLDWV
jgi:isoleucyl-tRNA synthetase